MSQARGNRRWSTRLALLCLALVAALPGAGWPQPRSVQSLTGDLLVASEEMRDPRFARAVIYMIRHDASGAQGLVVNHPLGEVSLARLLGQMGIDRGGASGTVRLHRGGPVEARRLLVLHSGDYAGDGTAVVKDGVAVSVAPDVLRAIADGRGPSRTLFALGYAGWAPGQLESEIEAGAWYRATADHATLFDGDHDVKWERAVARRKIDL
jgi:putative transcriptional regulator